VVYIGFVASFPAGGLRALVIGTALLCGFQARAHHSFTATYFPDKTVTLDGTVVQFLFRNPHSFVQVEAPGDTGRAITWNVEWGGGGQLSREGIERDTLKPGDHVIVTGNPSRNSADHRLHMQSITRPADGWKWSGSFQ
jgi:hypothetical protein